jgi:hypothetical protein
MGDKLIPTSVQLRIFWRSEGHRAGKRMTRTTLETLSLT